MNKRIHKLLAVVTFVGAASTSAIAAPRTLANGAPAPGNTIAKGETYSAESTTSRASRTAAALRIARTELATAIADENAAAAAMAAQPRTLANGAPACGNTNTKVSCQTARADREWNERVQRLVHAGGAVRAAQRRVAALEKQYAKLEPKPPAPALVGMNR